MNKPVQPPPAPPHGYAIEIEPLDGTVIAYRGDNVLARSDRAKVMYETRLPPTIYFPREDIIVPLSDPTDLRTFCPFKGTASYHAVELDDGAMNNAVWSYAAALPESREIAGFMAFGSGIVSRLDLGSNVLRETSGGNLSGPTVDWILREAWRAETPAALTESFALKLREHGIGVSRLSVMIWSLHPLIAGRNYIWDRGGDEVSVYAPSYEIHDHPAFVNSPLRHVSNGLGGVRQKLDTDYPENAFPILEDLREKGATDYVAMPLPFSDGQVNVLTITCDDPNGFSTEDLGLIFECSTVISRYYEVFSLKENAQSLLDTYVGKRTGSRVLGGDIRRGDGDEMDTAIMFCDLRGSTRLAEELGQAAYLDLLNRFFETADTIVQEHGGEVLKFIGDAVLAVFPATEKPDEACSQALEAAKKIVAEVRAAEHDGHDARCDCAVGVAFGPVTYGNVGSRERLDFTVIGHAANVAARLGDYGKSAGQCIVVTEEICNGCVDAEPLGAIALHNVSEPVMAYGIPV